MEIYLKDLEFNNLAMKVNKQLSRGSRTTIEK